MKIQRNISKMWEQHFTENTPIDSVFDALYLNQLISIKRPFSIAELLIEDADLVWLQRWFCCFKWNNIKESTTNIKFGLLFLILGSEMCRRYSAEGSVWPSFNKYIQNPGIREKYFLINGQPTEETKYLIIDVIKEFGIRNAIDIEGTQQWFETIKLQFGFTYTGAKNRLAEWLVGINPPHSVDYLLGNSKFDYLKSDSFISMWNALKQYRKGIIDEYHFNNQFSDSPWIKPEWIDDILKEARSKREILEYGDGHKSYDRIITNNICENEIDAIQDVLFEWEWSKIPHIRFVLNKEYILDNVTSSKVERLLIKVDGKLVCDWTKQPDGDWDASIDIYMDQKLSHPSPNLNPLILTIMTEDRSEIFKIDLAELGLREEIVLFNINNGKMVKPGFIRLDPNKEYALICEKETSIEGIQPAESYASGNRMVYRLPKPIENDFLIKYQGFIIWQIIDCIMRESDGDPIYLRDIDSTTKRLDDKIRLYIEGLPSDAKNIKLLIGNKIHNINCDDRKLITIQKVCLNPELIIGEKRLRIKYEIDEKPHNKTPKLKLNLFDAAMATTNLKNGRPEFISLKNSPEFNKSEDSCILYIWKPDQTNEDYLYEGSNQVGRIKYHKIRLKDMHGYGGQLSIHSEGKKHDLSYFCYESGCILQYCPPILGKPAQITLRLNDDENLKFDKNHYQLYYWTCDKQYSNANLVKIPSEKVTVHEKGNMWDVDYIDNPLCVIVTWKNAVLMGSIFNGTVPADYFEMCQSPSLKDFAILKWIKFPMLLPEYEPQLKKFIYRAPDKFLQAWLNNEGLPNEFTPREDGSPYKSIIRHFLWTYAPEKSKMGNYCSIFGNCGKSYNAEKCYNYLEKIASCSLYLFQHYLNECRENCKEWYQVLSYFSSKTAPYQQLSLKTVCEYFLPKISMISGIDEDKIRIATRWIACNIVKPNREIIAEHEDILHEIGEMDIGQRYVLFETVEWRRRNLNRNY